MQPDVALPPSGSPSSVARLCEELRSNAPRIVALWERAVAREPWILPRQHARPDFVPDLVTAIAAATVCVPPTRHAVRELAETAARHATGRRAEGVAHARVVLEYYFLRSAIWAYFGERHDAATAELRVILYVDVAVSVATRAALLGYYRRELEAQGSWPDALDRLVDELPPIWQTDRREGGEAPAAADG